MVNFVLCILSTHTQKKQMLRMGLGQRPSTFILAVELWQTWNEAHSQQASTQILDKHKQFQHCWAGYTVALSLTQRTYIQKLFPSPLKAWFSGCLSSTPSVHKNRTREPEQQQSERSPTAGAVCWQVLVRS